MRQSFSADERRVLALVLDEIVPPSGDGKLPGAGQADVIDYVDRVLGRMTDLRSMVTQGLVELDEAARGRHGQAFTDLGGAERAALLSEQGFVFPLTLHAYAGYYQTPRVVEALGLEARAPHPGGYSMASDDMSLLDVVKQRPKMFRKC